MPCLITGTVILMLVGMRDKDHKGVHNGKILGIGKTLPVTLVGVVDTLSHQEAVLESPAARKGMEGMGKTTAKKIPATDLTGLHQIKEAVAHPQVCMISTHVGVKMVISITLGGRKTDVERRKEGTTANTTKGTTLTTGDTGLPIEQKEKVHLLALPIGHDLTLDHQVGQSHQSGQDHPLDHDHGHIPD